MDRADQSREEIHALVRAAIVEQRPIEAVDHGQLRLLCPHVLGWSKQGRLQMLCYQYGGGSQSSLGVGDGSANWRGMALDGLSDVEWRSETWQSAEFGAQPQTCVVRMEVAVRGWPKMIRSKDSAEVAEAGGGPS